MTKAITPRTDHELAEQSIFDKAVAIVLDTLSPTSRRVYLRTYRAWTQFASEHGFDVIALTLDNIRAFIHEADVAKTTRQNRLSHTRKLLELLAIGDGHYRQHYNAVKAFLKVQANDGDKSRAERVKRALNPHEATALLGVWRNDSRDVGIRNDVMIRLLVYAGLRRSELIALRWTDINVENLTITVRHGGGYASASGARQCSDYAALCSSDRRGAAATSDKLSLCVNSCCYYGASVYRPRPPATSRKTRLVFAREGAGEWHIVSIMRSILRTCGRSCAVTAFLCALISSRAACAERALSCAPSSRV